MKESLAPDDPKPDVKYKLTEIFTLEEIQQLQDLFAAATGVASIITEPDGTPITRPSNFCTLCNDIIRKTEIGFKNCQLSDSIVGSPNVEGPRVQRCLSGGLIDGGVSIIVNGQHIANWLIGQVLDEDYDIEELLAYADVIGADREAYKAALSEVNRMSMAQFKKVCDFLFFNAQQLSRQAIRSNTLSHEVTRITSISMHDHLTGLYNRRFYEQELIRLDTADNIPISMIMADVNGLKLTNDTFGHKAGDHHLKRIAEILKHECRESDIIARVGGDEFVVLLPHTDEHEAEKLIERINLAISNEKMDRSILSVAMGHATKYQEYQDIEEIFKHAEDNMYRQKLTESAAIRKRFVRLALDSLFAKSKSVLLHSKRVADICEAIGREMGFNDADLNRLKTAGLMHDIGKIGINESILEKTSRLTGTESKEIKRLSEIGFKILNSNVEYSDIAGYILAMHERWDGGGYPNGLAGEQIPVQSRIISIADAYYSMMTAKPYREAMSMNMAVAEIKKCAGKQFDPAVARIFVEKVLGREW